MLRVPNLLHFLSYICHKFAYCSALTRTVCHDTRCLHSLPGTRMRTKRRHTVHAPCNPSSYAPHLNSNLPIRFSAPEGSSAHPAQARPPAVRQLGGAPPVDRPAALRGTGRICLASSVQPPAGAGLRLLRCAMLCLWRVVSSAIGTCSFAAVFICGSLHLRQSSFAAVVMCNATYHAACSTPTSSSLITLGTTAKSCGLRYLLYTALCPPTRRCCLRGRRCSWCRRSCW